MSRSQTHTRKWPMMRPRSSQLRDGLACKKKCDDKFETQILDKTLPSGRVGKQSEVSLSFSPSALLSFCPSPSCSHTLSFISFLLFFPPSIHLSHLNLSSLPPSVHPSHICAAPRALITCRGHVGSRGEETESRVLQQRNDERCGRHCET